VALVAAIWKVEISMFRGGACATVVVWWWEARGGEGSAACIYLRMHAHVPASQRRCVCILYQTSPIKPQIKQRTHVPARRACRGRA
jgi:hypothetical protein